MVVGAFPAAKLVALLLKQVSKPIANVAKEKAKNSYGFRTYVCMPPAQSYVLVRQVHKPASKWIQERAKQSQFFRSKICMPPAQFYHWCEVKMKMWVMNLGRPVEIPKLNEAMAIELGANLLGEGIIFIIAASILTAEYIRSSVKEANKETARLEAMQELRDLIRDLEMETQRQDTQMRELNRLCVTFSSALQQQQSTQSGTKVATDQRKPSASLSHAARLGIESQVSTTRYTDSWLERAVDYSLESMIKR